MYTNKKCYIEDFTAIKKLQINVKYYFLPRSKKKSNIQYDL